MQTLNVDAGRTNEEYKEAQEKRRSDLRADSQEEANFFFWAAGVALLGTGFLTIRLNVFVNIGAIDFLRFYGPALLGSNYHVALYGVEVTWLLILVGLGFGARRGLRWPFLVGIALYVGDMVLLLMTFSLWASGVHAFFVYRWFQGQKALKDSKETSVARNAIAPDSQLV